MSKTRITIASVAVTAATVIGVGQALTPKTSDLTPGGHMQQADEQGADAQEALHERQRRDGQAHGDAERARRQTPAEHRRAQRALRGLLRRVP